MSTDIQIRKAGVKLQCDVSSHPRPRPKGAWPVPNFPPSGGESMLSVTLETIPGASRKGIRVASTPTTLPGGPTAVWTLRHAAYQGTAPDPLPWEEMAVSGPTFSLLLSDPMPRAMHRFSLRRVEAGQQADYAEATIATPDDPWMPLSLEGILVDDLVAAAEKAGFKAYYDSATGEQAGLDALADTWLCSRVAYDAAMTALTAAITAMSPAHTDLTHDTSLGAGGGAVMLGKFATVYSTRDALKAAIQAAISGGTGDVWSDDKLTPSEKRSVKQWRDDIVNEQTAATVGLDAMADKAGVSRVAYDQTITDLTAWLNGLTSTGGWSSSTNDWTNYTSTYSLGAGGGATGRGKFVAVYAARMALVGAIQSISLDTTPQDTFRPLHKYDFGPAIPAGATATYCTESACPAPDAASAMRYTAGGSGYGQSGPMLEFVIPRLTAGKDMSVICARLRYVSGTWMGKANYQTSGHGYSDSYRKTIAAPRVGEWVTVFWDMKNLTAGAYDFVNATDVQKIRIQLGDSAAVIDVDRVEFGIWNSGSAYDSWLAIQDMITAALALGNVTVLQNLIVGNVSNLWPNPDSELTGLPPDCIGAVGLDMNGTQQFRGVGCRKVTAGQTLRPTLRTQANEGEAYFFSAMCRVTAGTGTIRFEAFDPAGQSLGYCSGDSLSTTITSYFEVFGFITVPAGATSIQAVVSSTTGTFYLDCIVWRKATDGRLIVPGQVVANHVSSTFAESWFLRLGPNYRFISKSGGNYLEPQSDGGFKRPSSGEVANTNDATYYCDASRLHPGRAVMRYQASFWGSTTALRSIIVGLSSAWATTGLAGYELRRDPANARFGLFAVSGVGSYTQIGSWITLASASSTEHERMKLKLYNPASPSSGTVRLEAYFDGVLRKAWTHGDLSSPGTISGYAALKLSDAAVRVGMIAFGAGNVVAEGGNVEADCLEADILKTSNYAENGSGYATAGAKMSLDTNPLKVGPGGMRLGPNGYLVDELTMRALNLLCGNGQSGSSFMGWYNGNNRTDTKGGAPNVLCLNLQNVFHEWTNNSLTTQWNYRIQPSALTDNLDGLTYIEIEMYPPSGGSTPAKKIFQAIVGRAYADTSSHSAAANAVFGSFITKHRVASSWDSADGDYHTMAHLRVRLWNLYGPSDWRWYHPASIDSWNSGDTSAPSGSPAAGGGGGSGNPGGACPDVDTPIRTSRGLVRAGDLQPGDIVETFHETTLAHGSWDVEMVSTELSTDRLQVFLEDGRSPITVSRGHRFYVSRGGWMRVQDLYPGALLLGSHPAVVAEVLPAGPGEVVKITVSEAHTYLTGGILSHNIKQMTE